MQQSVSEESRRRQQLIASEVSYRSANFLRKKANESEQLRMCLSVWEEERGRDTLYLNVCKVISKIFVSAICLVT